MSGQGHDRFWIRGERPPVLVSIGPLLIAIGETVRRSAPPFVLWQGPGA
jgi:hypothetical protein